MSVIGVGELVLLGHLLRPSISQMHGPRKEMKLPLK